MKKVLILLVMLLSFNNITIAQTYTRSGNTYISSTGERTRSKAIETKFKTKEFDGKEYTIYCSKSSGACFIKRISRKGNEYKKYLGEEISREICKEIGIEYKPRKK